MGQMWQDYVWIEGFPSTLTHQTAFTPDDMRHAPAPPLERNRTMVDEGVRHGDAILVAAPKGMDEERRSGPWATIRYARKRGLPTYVCWPDGTTKFEGRSVKPHPKADNGCDGYFRCVLTSTPEEGLEPPTR